MHIFTTLPILLLLGASNAREWKVEYPNFREWKVNYFKTARQQTKMYPFSGYIEDIDGWTWDVPGFTSIQAVITAPKVKPPACDTGPGIWSGSAFVAMDALRRARAKWHQGRWHAVMPEAGITWQVMRDKYNRTESRYFAFSNCVNNLPNKPNFYQTWDGGQNQVGFEIFVDEGDEVFVSIQANDLGVDFRDKTWVLIVIENRTKHQKISWLTPCGYRARLHRSDAGWLVSHEDVTQTLSLWRTHSNKIPPHGFHPLKFHGFADFGTVKFANISSYGPALSQGHHLNDESLCGNCSAVAYKPSQINDLYVRYVCPQ